MKYRLSPFHLVSLIFLFQSVRYLIIVVKAGDEAELGALLPFAYLLCFLGTLLADFLIQFVISLTIKSDTKKILYLIQILILVIIAVFTIETVHRAD